MKVRIIQADGTEKLCDECGYHVFSTGERETPHSLEVG